MMRWFLPLFFFFALSAAGRAQLVPRGSEWKYLDDGSDQGVAWYDPSFDDSLWASGSAQLGYGDGDEETVVDFGPNPNNKFITTYFRHSFQVVDPTNSPVLSLRLLRDDGAVVYLNGVEAVRQNLAAGPIDYLTRANNAVGDAGESTYRAVALDATLLVAGENVVAVEVHQVSPTSSDISFDLELDDSFASTVIRGPYLQQGTETSMTFRWRTFDSSDSFVAFGPTLNDQVQTEVNAEVTTEHEVTVTGLEPDSEYFYTIGSSLQKLRGGPTYRFRTAPISGVDTPTRIWVLGDSGTANVDARAVRDAYTLFAGGVPPDVWLMLGDNAYNSGTDIEYQGGVFDTYTDQLLQTPLWAARGNHDSSLNVFENVFSFPTAGEAGGFPSGSESYYSFDYANIHFVCLDSQGSNRNVDGPMLTWLVEDLASTTQDWIVAYWHHPPYTKGSHNSDSPADSGGRMRDMRENAVPILEAGGVDLVLTGHSHSYERSMLIDGHYLNSPTFDPSMIKDGGDGNPFGDGAYEKTTGSRAGAIYSVAGSSGKISGGPLNHPIMIASINSLGSVVIDVDGDVMQVRFLDDLAAVIDSYEIHTGAEVFDFVTSEAIAGEPMRLQVSAATPGADVYFAYSISGDGPTNTPFGPVDLSPPIEQIGPVTVDENGVAMLVVNVPVNASGLTLHMQALEFLGPGSGNLTPSRTTIVQ